METKEKAELREKMSEFIEYNKKLSEAGQGWRVDHQMMWIRDSQAQYLLTALDYYEKRKLQNQ